MTLQIEVIVDRGMNGSEFLKGLYVPEPGHCSFSSSEWLVRILGPVVEPPAAFLALCHPNSIHCGAIGAKTIRHDHLWPTVTLHRALQKRMRSIAIPAFRGKDFEHLAFLIDCPPEIVRLAVDSNEHLIYVPSPLRI